MSVRGDAAPRGMTAQSGSTMCVPLGTPGKVAFSQGKKATRHGGFEERPLWNRLNRIRLTGSLADDDGPGGESLRGRPFWGERRVRGFASAARTFASSRVRVRCADFREFAGSRPLRGRSRVRGVRGGLAGLLSHPKRRERVQDGAPISVPGRRRLSVDLWFPTFPPSRPFDRNKSKGWGTGPCSFPRSEVLDLGHPDRWRG
jgi:hypothetical protein